MTTFNEVVKTKTNSCKKCFSMTYALPCIINAKLGAFLNSFGLPIYPVEATKLLRIDSFDGFKIEARIGSKTIKLAMPKKFEKVALEEIKRKVEFEQKLAEWMSDVLNIEIDY